MGTISLDWLWPERFGDPNQAGAISPLGLPVAADRALVGFARDSTGSLIFGDELRVAVRLCEREWQYVQMPDVGTVQSARRWRLEFGVDIHATGPLQPGHRLIV